MKSYEMQLKPYLSRQVMEDSALYKEECYDYRIYCAVKDIDENGIPEFLLVYLMALTDFISIIGKISNK